MLDIAQHIRSLVPTGLEGSVVRTIGLTAAVADFPAPVGALVDIDRQTGDSLEAEVIGFRDELTLLYPLRGMAGVRHGNRVRLRRTTRTLPVGPELLGRVIDAHGRAIDGRPQPALPDRVPLDRRPSNALERPPINSPLTTGVRAIDSLLTCGKGQRMGVFAAAGVGKSVTLGMMARYTAADVNVIALIGERGREVNEFLERDLGPAGLARSVVVVATSDEPALVRVHAAFAATAVAEHFRDSGKDVLLLMDSVTRFALAQREIGLAAGEPPTTRGFPPSVFATLPKLVERAGRTKQGSITGFYSVLVEGDDPNEPVSDCIRGLLDGHTLLSRKLAGRGHYPAVDVLTSLSRLMSTIVPRPVQEAATTIRELMSAYVDHEDLISIGAYRRGSNLTVDVAMDVREEIDKFLKQRVDEPTTVAAAHEELLALARRCGQRRAALQAAAAAANNRTA